MAGSSLVEVLEPDAAEDRQRRVAGSLARAGLAAGDRVALRADPSATALVCVLGALRAGIVPVLLNTSLLDHERDALLADAEVALVVDDRASMEVLLDGPAADIAPWPLARPMHYTSGTTGRPKGVWSGVLSEAEAEALFSDEADLWEFGPRDAHLVCSPLYHSVSVRLAAAALLRGGRVGVLGPLKAGQAVEAISSWQPTTTFMAPTVLGRVLDALRSPDAGRVRGRAVPAEPSSALRSLRLLIHAGSACPSGLKRAAVQAAPPGSVWEFYGSTEGQFTVCPPDEWLAHPGTVGRARPGRVLSVDDEGMVWCRAPTFARWSYWADPAATARAWRDGAFSVGDLGHLDADGRLFLSGRRDDLVITGGVNVYPAEVEAALAELDGVVEVAVFAMADDDWGQVVCAAVVGEVGESALRDHATARLAPYKRPKRYFVLDELPRSTTGKLLRRLVAPAVGIEPAAPAD